MRLICLTALILLFLNARGQTSVQLSASEIKAGIEKLSPTARVLYIAAHPDDENTRLLAYLANERKVRTAYLSLTRGDGGQNLIGPEQSEQLGLIRTQELLAARKIDGAEQFFTRANDFGFSKTAEETFRIWNKKEILADVVWVIRSFRPDVIITRFPGDARAGHGQHAASSILAQEAFKAAADPNAFTEQFKYVTPWKTSSIFWNTYNFGSLNTTGNDQLKIDVGAYNALLGKGYGEIAAQSRSQHKSQGFGVAAQRGEATEYFVLLDGAPVKADLLENIPLYWTKDPSGKKIRDLLAKINAEYAVDQPEKSVPEMLRLRELFQNIQDKLLRKQKLKELDDLILAAAGIWFEAYSPERVFASGDALNVRVQAISRNNLQAVLSVGKESITLPPNQLQSLEITARAANITQPYWLAEKHPIGGYVVNDPLLIGRPSSPAPLSLRFSLKLYGTELHFTRPVVYKYTDPIRGEVYQPLEIAPAVVANLETPQLLFTDNKARQIRVKLKAFRANSTGFVRLAVPKGWNVQPAKADFDLKKKAEEQEFTFTISPGAGATSGKLTAEIHIGSETLDRSIQTISYDHIPAITWYPPAEASLVKLDLKTGGKKIGYIPGAGDLIPQSLRQIGYEVDILGEPEIMNSDLSGYDAIITGVRLYNVEPRVRFMNQKLLDYVHNGGILLVQYNVNQPLLTDQIGPYPFSITRNRVTEEQAAVTILDPGNRLFSFPNQITQQDFEGWVQERGIYFAEDQAGKYRKLLSMNDAGEGPQNGALLVSDYGKGRFIYTGLAFFRQLPAGVPGAYRLFVNLISK